MLTLVSIPEPATFLEEIATWSNPFFAEFQWVIYIGVGLVLGGLAVHFIINVFIDGVTYFQRYDKNHRNMSSWIAYREDGRNDMDEYLKRRGR